MYWSKDLVWKNISTDQLGERNLTLTFPVLRIYKGVYIKIILKIRDKIQCNKNMSIEIIMLMFASMHLSLKS